MPFYYLKQNSADPDARGIRLIKEVSVKIGVSEDWVCDRWHLKTGFLLQQNWRDIEMGSINDRLLPFCVYPALVEETYRNSQVLKEGVRHSTTEFFLSARIILESDS